ncbi:hypothetical protein BD289DRAFT_363501 [Coniella lustricola]|uniref:Calponin-homology (CH) domain-containing protein n=1 Tax=Coniella lustricola TaxID=2025994 RepID=A0A2T3AF38_9PEZI|nr:hypothetical protein BD289DRAFT_363501 [Coniella lustricola]
MSVTSLDRDLRKLRLDKYTPAAANEVRAWIEGVLGERLPSGDLLEGLKDGVALCKLVNRVLPPPGVKFKTSSMPFVQMENISHFLRACKSPPLNLQEHDMFLTVDLYEAKDPAQVLQCLGAFSRVASQVAPAAFATAPGARAAGLSPQRTGTPGHLSPTPTATSSFGVSSWSSRAHEGVTSPAWNIAQYGYMGGASQGNLGISFGGRRQITSAGPAVPSLAEKQKLRKQKEAEEQRQREEDEARQRAQREAEEEAARLEEQARQRDEEARLLEEKRRWEEEERQWKITEEKRRREEEEAEKRLAEERGKVRSRANSRLHGQFLSQYQAENGTGGSSGSTADDPAQRIRELEEELARARQREAEYENERQTRLRVKTDAKARIRSRSRPRSSTGTPTRQDSWARGDDSDGEGLKQAWQERKPRPLPPLRQHSRETSPKVIKTPSPVTTSRPLPDPRKYSQSPPTLTASSQMNRTDRFLATSQAPVQQQQQQQQPPPPKPPTYSRELGATAERDAEDRRRQQTQQHTKAGGWASKSLLEREMEMERQRQREWEASQKETAKAARSGQGVDGIGGGIGGKWDVGQWAGFTGGDNQNRGTQGIGAGRRQIVGPRPLPNTPESGA